MLARLTLDEVAGSEVVPSDRERDRGARRALVLALTGLALGLCAAPAATRVLTGLLYGVTATDATAFLIPALGLPSVALLSSLGPALRASRIEPGSLVRM